jgi:hypothetical protein
MLGNREQIGKRQMKNSWQKACWQVRSECPEDEPEVTI